jgi:hypothetical protein
MAASCRNWAGYNGHSGSGESWFEPRRGNEARQRLTRWRASPFRGVRELLTMSELSDDDGVVDAPHDEQVPVLIEIPAVTGQLVSGIPLQVPGAKPLVVSPQRGQRVGGSGRRMTTARRGSGALVAPPRPAPSSSAGRPERTFRIRRPVTKPSAESARRSRRTRTGNRC